MNILDEVRRRNVHRVAIAYIAGAWLLIQVAETLLPLFGFFNSTINVTNSTVSGNHLSGLVTPAQTGSAWTLRCPNYQVVIPHGLHVAAPLVYPVDWEANELEEFVQRWVELIRHDGTANTLYDYWILGKGASRKHIRWSVVRDVLGWVD